jgi:tryptophan synthase beta chain
MVRSSFYQKPYRKSLINLWGATVIPSPSTETQFGRMILEKYPDTSGSVGIAISEAIEEAALNDNTKYALGSVLNHTCLHQTVIGLETQKQFEKTEDYPDIVIGCCGGGK